MGGIVAPMSPQFQEDGFDPNGEMIRWRNVKTLPEARKLFEADGSLPKDASNELLELREFLEEPNLLRPLGLFSKGMKNIDVLMCWVDIQGFKSIHEDAVDFRRSTAMHIYHKYIKEGSACQIAMEGEEDSEWVETVKDSVDDISDEVTDPESDMFDYLQHKCFYRIYKEIFVYFQRTKTYVDALRSLKADFNQVAAEDFEYMEKLGQGTFGLVVRCRKRSTGCDYAMKIQTKVGLLKCYYDVPHRVDGERQALAACHHPFIVSMHYAFQTKSLIMMTMDLGRSGSLLDALHACPNEQMPEDRIRFYVSEIILALAHLHRMGFIYRDLKPQNILLCDDGHIKLVDMGGAIDVGGRIVKNYTEFDENKFGLFSPEELEFSVRNIQDTNSRRVSAFQTWPNFSTAANLGGHAEASGSSSSGSAPPPSLNQVDRAVSVMGTYGYMAPEVLILLNQTPAEKKGYTCCVDWWSLGATMFKLLTGKLPFPKVSPDVFEQLKKPEVKAAYDREVKELVVSRPLSRRESGDGKADPRDSKQADRDRCVLSFQYMQFLQMLEEVKIGPNMISNECIDMTLRLLTVNDGDRLGFKGAREVKKHDFVRDVPWALLEQRHVIPPYRPAPVALSRDPVYTSLANVLIENGKAGWLGSCPNPADEKYFKNWNYISPITVKLEMGLANIMDERDDGFKIKADLETKLKSNAPRKSSTGSIGTSIVTGLTSFLSARRNSDAVSRASALSSPPLSRKFSVGSAGSSTVSNHDARRNSAASVYSDSSGKEVPPPVLGSPTARKESTYVQNVQVIYNIVQDGN